MLAQLLLMAMVPPSFSSAQHDPGWSGSGDGGSESRGSESRGGSEPGGFLGNVARAWATDTPSDLSESFERRRPNEARANASGFFGNVLANATAAAKNDPLALPPMFQESDPRHKRKRGSNATSTVLMRVVWIERAMAFQRAGRPDFIAAAVAPLQNASVSSSFILAINCARSLYDAVPSA